MTSYGTITEMKEVEPTLINLPNKHLIREDEVARFMAENGEDIKRECLKVSYTYPGSTYIHTSIDLQEDGHVRQTEAVVPEGMIYIDFTKLKLT